MKGAFPVCYADSLTPADTLAMTPGTDVQHTSSRSGCVLKTALSLL